MVIALLPGFLAWVLFASAKTIVVNVGGNTTADAGAVFKPRVIEADQGDVVHFNFTQGNHTVIQALFASPCIPAHEIDSTVNGFNSGFRDAGNFTDITELLVPINNPNTTIWFYDHNTCAQGGVGGININETSLETIDGFERNAIRLNGTGKADTTTSRGAASPSTTSTDSGTGSNAEPSDEDNAGQRTIIMGAILVLPLLAAAAGL